MKNIYWKRVSCIVLTAWFNWSPKNASKMYFKYTFTGQNRTVRFRTSQWESCSSALSANRENLGILFPKRRRGVRRIVPGSRVLDPSAMWARGSEHSSLTTLTAGKFLRTNLLMTYCERGRIFLNCDFKKLFLDAKEKWIPS